MSSLHGAPYSAGPTQPPTHTLLPEQTHLKVPGTAAGDFWKFIFSTTSIMRGNLPEKDGRKERKIEGKNG